jgi:hypothetical protein
MSPPDDPERRYQVEIKDVTLGPWIIEADGESHGAARSTLAVRSTIAHVSGRWHAVGVSKTSARVRRLK